MARARALGGGPVRVHAGSRSHASERARRSETSEVNHRFVETNDQRGYGGTDRPDQVERYTQLHLIGNVIGLLNALGEEQAVVVEHDWDAPIAWNTALLRPNRVRGVVGLSVPYLLVARWSAAQTPAVHDVSITLPLRFLLILQRLPKELTYTGDAPLGPAVNVVRVQHFREPL